MVDLCNISGIGRAICKALYEGGAEVYALSRTQSTLDSLKEEVTLTYSQIYKPIIAYLHVWYECALLLGRKPYWVTMFFKTLSQDMDINVLDI